MNMVHEQRPYRHFKGKLYFVHSITEETESGTLYVHYQALYPPYAKYVRKLDDFLAKVDVKREDNITGQATRFMLYDGKMKIH